MNIMGNYRSMGAAGVEVIPATAPGALFVFSDDFS